MSRCAHCQQELPNERLECEDVKACSKRVAKRLNERVSSMVTKQFLDFNPVEAYRDSPKLGDS